MDEACCLYSADDDEPPEFFNESIVRARKIHRCYECHEDIGIGVRYESTSGKWDGRMDTFRTCLSCVEIRAHFACGGRWIYGELWSSLVESFFPDMTAGGPCFKGLSPEAIGRLFERRLKWLLEDS